MGYLVSRYLATYTSWSKQVCVSLALGGASAGSITALALASLDEPQHEKSTKLIDILANMPMANFVDGKDNDDTDSSDFIDTMLKRPGLARGLWKGFQVIDNLDEMMGLQSRRAIPYLAEERCS